MKALSGTGMCRFFLARPAGEENGETFFAYSREMPVLQDFAITLPETDLP